MREEALEVGVDVNAAEHEVRLARWCDLAGVATCRLPRVSWPSSATTTPAAVEGDS
jgi:hypothetical protein